MAAAAATTTNSPFIRELATSDAHTRAEALEKLRKYVQVHGRFSELECLKLWKGLFFCMWMADGAKFQHRLAVDLAGLVECLPEKNVLLFIDAFWKTMAREWTGIDSLRMDKYLTLIRQYLAASLRYLSRNGWSNQEAIAEYMAILEKTPLNATDNRIPNGLRYHLLDIYVDELDRVDAHREAKMPLEQLLLPLRHLAKHSPMKSIRESANEALEDERLKDWSVVPGQDEDEDVDDSESDAAAAENDDEDEDDEWAGFEE